MRTAFTSKDSFRRRYAVLHDLNRLAQRTCKRFHDRLGDMVRFDAGQDFNVDGHSRVVTKTAQEFTQVMHVKTVCIPFKSCRVKMQIRPTAHIDHAARQGLIHWHVRVGVPPYASPIPKRLVIRHPKRDTHVFGKVVNVNSVNVPTCVQLKGNPTVASELIKEMRQETVVDGQL